MLALLVLQAELVATAATASRIKKQDPVVVAAAGPVAAVLAVAVAVLAAHRLASTRTGPELSPRAVTPSRLAVLVRAVPLVREAREAPRVPVARVVTRLRPKILMAMGVMQVSTVELAHLEQPAPLVVPGQVAKLRRCRVIN